MKQKDLNKMRDMMNELRPLKEIAETLGLKSKKAIYYWARRDFVDIKRKARHINLMDIISLGDETFAVSKIEKLGLTPKQDLEGSHLFKRYLTDRIKFTNQDEQFIICDLDEDLEIIANV